MIGATMVLEVVERQPRHAGLGKRELYSQPLITPVLPEVGDLLQICRDPSVWLEVRNRVWSPDGAITLFLQLLVEYSDQETLIAYQNNPAYRNKQPIKFFENTGERSIVSLLVEDRWTLRE